VGAVRVRRRQPEHALIPILVVLGGVGLAGAEVTVLRRSPSTPSRRRATVRPRRITPPRARRWRPHRPTVSWWAVAVALFWAATATPIYIRLNQRRNLVYGGNDQPAHIYFAQLFRLWPFRPSQPHFLLHLIVRLGWAPFGSHAATPVMDVVLIGATAVTGVGVFLWARADDVLGPSAAAGAAILVLWSESPTALVRRTVNLTTGHPFGVLHSWWTPTNAVALPSMLLLGAVLVGTIDERQTWWTRDEAIAGAVVVSMLAKPNVALCLVPAAFAMVVVRQGSRNLAVARRLLLWAVVPMGIVAAIQLEILRTLPPDLYNSGFVIAPFRLLRRYHVQDPLFWAVLLLPALVLAVGGRPLRSKVDVRLAFAALLTAVVQFSLFAESGTRADDGNWGLGVLFSFWFVYVVTARYGFAMVLGRNAADARPVSSRARVSLSVLASIYVIAGLFAGLNSMGVR
jgi:hypothetical protein